MNASVDSAELSVNLLSQSLANCELSAFKLAGVHNCLINELQVSDREFLAIFTDNNAGVSWLTTALRMEYGSIKYEPPVINLVSFTNCKKLALVFELNTSKISYYDKCTYKICVGEVD